MECEVKRGHRRLAFAAVCLAMLAVAALTATLLGCSPSQPTADTGSGTAAEQNVGEASSDDAAAGQPVNWTMESDCVTCHTAEAESATDSACPQGTAHEAQGVTCVTCHTDEAVLAEVHDGIAMGDKPATKATVVTVDEATCIACHGEMSEVAALTADSTALTDDKGTTVNPHERPAGEKHDENPTTCTDCHNNHSKDLPKDAMKYCAQCHHRGTFECGTCHELRER